MERTDLYVPPGIEGWMTDEELQFLYETAGRMRTIAEIGCWKGRSAHALCAGVEPGTVTLVDHFEGSLDPHDDTFAADPVVIFWDLLQNLKEMHNYKVIVGPSDLVAEIFPDGAFDMVFIDADHSYDAVTNDIRVWLPKARGLLCGHDYSADWPDVKRAVDEQLGEIELHGAIWSKWKGTNAV